MGAATGRRHRRRERQGLASRPARVEPLPAAEHGGVRRVIVVVVNVIVVVIVVVNSVSSWKSAGASTP